MKAYIARDMCGTVWLHKIRPHKYTFNHTGMWCAMEGYLKIDESDLPEGINPQWEDTEPIEVELTITKRK